MKPGSDTSGTWLIPFDQVVSSGSGTDVIPVLTQPGFYPLWEAAGEGYLDKWNMVIGMRAGHTVKAYPHSILNWHNIVHDSIDGIPVAVTYGPLTGSGIGIYRIVNGIETTFGITRFRYNSNFMPYDKLTGSIWSQMKLLCVNGDLAGEIFETIPVLETTWATWKEMFPESLILSDNTGYIRPYSIHPYRDYRTNDDNIMFPVENEDNRLPAKERIHGIVIGDMAKAFSLTEFPMNIHIVNHEMGNVSLVTVGSRDKNFAMTFQRTTGNSGMLSFEPVNDALPAVMTDNSGTLWDVFGYALNGNHAGERLKPVTAFTSYWFAWAAFYPDTEIHEF